MRAWRYLAVGRVGAVEEGWVVFIFGVDRLCDVGK